MSTRPDRIRYFCLALLVVLAALGSVVAVVVHRVDSRNEAALLDSLKGEESLATRAMAREVSQALAGAAADLAFLEHETESLLAAGDDPEDLAALYEAFAKSHPAYDQLRLLSADGRERLRINHRDGDLTRAPPAELQDKAARDYVANALALGAGERLVTPLDFNREHGEIEIPRVPVLRFIAPLAGVAGAKAGLLILNYRASVLLSNIVVVGGVALGEPHIVRGVGSWVLESQGADPDAFSLHLASGGRDFASTYPEAWRVMQTSSEGNVRTPEGLFSFARIRPGEGEAAAPASASRTPWTVVGGPLPSERAGWYLVSHVAPEQLAAMLDPVKLSNPRSLMLIGALAVLASVFIALFLERYRSGLKHWRQRATVDALTGLLNRDEFNRRLEQALALANRSNRATALVFVDLNDFKPLNDQFGHAAGDRALAAVADRLLSACRRSDVVARLGGDEFAVILWEVSGRADSAKIVDKIENAVGQPLIIEGRRVPLSASVGAATYPDDGRTMESLLHHADMAMYAHKRRRRALLSQPEATG